MTLKKIFEKPVNRPIEGVIKADDDASLRIEVEEYVLTQEVEKRLEAFLDAYHNYEGANGVWVSGFFGSGKSHLLKMLALLLENRTIDGEHVLDLFLPKCGDNEILRGDLKRAALIPSKSILFNIDQKADVISKAQIDALLAVFVKVFDEMCGYYGKQGHIAQFERELDSNGQYEPFKKTYEALTGRTWQTGREQALLESKNIAKAYAQVTGDDETQAVGILDKYRSQYKVSIEDFANQVFAYIEKQAPGFRLNFFVDEVGQYVADNTKLMTNLQTVAESLATKCRGRAWVVVTAQEDMGKVIGEMEKQQGNDFSKIQDRFKNRMKLTSADVAEVIQKRLLLKNENGVSRLSGVYHEQSNNMKTLFDFADGSHTYRNFQDRDHFIHCYPFIPYQFTLFQSAIQSLSDHNAFEGKHSSVGERSMLGVFQQVAIKISDHAIGQLATFDLMFEGIRSALKSSIQKAVIQAEAHLSDSFAIQVLKALFLVKYVKEFKPTLRNMCILMVEAFNQDLPVLRKRVEEALNLLEHQTYIQRNGEIFEYLTDEEKDVEAEIKNTEVESSDVTAELEKLVFESCMKTKKIRYDDNDYPFSRKIDDRLYGREYELAVHVITPFHEHAEDEFILKNQSMGRNELLVVLPSDDRFFRDLLMYKRTEKYIRQNITITQQDVVKRILSDKGSQNQERYAELQNKIRFLISNATLYASGNKTDIKTEDPQNRITTGFYELITKIYPNLRMLRGVSYTENDVAKCLKYSDESLFGTDVVILSEAEQEMFAMIQSNNQNGVRTTLKNLVEKFERKPYGWGYPSILCILAKLCARNKVDVRKDSNLLEGDDLLSAIRNSHGHANIILDPQVEYSATQVRSLKEFYEDFFDSPPRSGEAKPLGQETSQAITKMLEALTPIASQVRHYPFLKILDPVMERLKELRGKPYAWFLTALSSQENALLDMKEQAIDPVQKFWHGSQKDIYDKARAFVKDQDANFPYLANTADETITAEKLSQALTDPDCFKGNRMQQVKAMMEGLQNAIDIQIETEMAKAREKIERLKNSLHTMDEFDRLSEDKKESMDRAFESVMTTIHGHSLIAVIRERANHFEENEYPRLLEKLVEKPTPKPSPDDPKIKETQKPFIPTPAIKHLKSIEISFKKPWLTDEGDVDLYLESLREALLKEIRDGNKVQL